MTPRTRLALAFLLAAALAAAVFVGSNEDAREPTSPHRAASTAPARGTTRAPVVRAGRADDPAAPGRSKDTPEVEGRQPGAWDGEFAVEVRDRDTDAPIEGADVSIAPFRAEAPPRTATTDAGGSATLPWWTERARLIIRKRGYRPVATTPRDALGAESPEGEPAVVRLVAAPPMDGRVVDPSGAPIAGAQVAVWVPHELEDWDVVQVTGVDGRFTFAGIPDGCDVQIAAAAPGFVTRQIQVRSSPAVTFTITLGRGVSISGTVRYGDGPVAGADVTVVAGELAAAPPPREPPHLAIDRNRGHRAVLEAPTLSDAGGHFALRGLESPQTYTVQARTASGAAGASSPVVLRPGESRTDVTVVIGQLTTVRVTLVPPEDVTLTGRIEVRLDDVRPTAEACGVETTFDAVLPGRHTVKVRVPGFLARTVTVDAAPRGVTGIAVPLSAGLTIRGRVADDTGAAVPGASVWAEVDGDFPSVESRDDGSFELAGLPPGPVTLHAGADERVTTAREGVVPGGDEVVLVLLRTASVVVTVDGAADAVGARWGYEAGDGGGSSMSGGPRADGRYTISGVSPGVETDVFVQPAGRPAWVRRGLVLGAGEVRDLGTVTLPDPCEIAGVVTGESGSPLEGAWIRCIDSRFDPQSEKTGPDGRFRLRTLAGRAYRVFFEANGYAVEERELTASPSPAPVTVRLVRKVVLRGRILLPETVVLPPGISIQATPIRADGTQDPRTVTLPLDEFGAFSAQVAPGRWTVWAPGTTFSVVPVTVDVLEGTGAEVELRLK